jgi:acetylornithine deacetylase/succinyl-diaminopimelate desuccinylase-like protein
MRVYARSASDDKAGVMAILAAVDALRAEGRRPSFNLKIVFEGEEEAGSPNLAALARRHRDVLRSDGWIIVDGPAHQSGPAQLSLGVRGVVGGSLTVYGPVRPLHSGHYGNWAPNPAMMLAQLLASLKDSSVA